MTRLGEEYRINKTIRSTDRQSKQQQRDRKGWREDKVKASGKQTNCTRLWFWAKQLTRLVNLHQGLLTTGTLTTIISLLSEVTQDFKNLLIKSKLVKLMLTAIGPLIQFMLRPL